ncbi:MAG: helix-turn-helix domain-containing protein [Candidatus Micrarchaeia archaeon]|jgi:predicted DNA binding protein
MSKAQEDINKAWHDKKVKAAIIGFYHQGCQTSTSTEKFPNIRLEQVSPVIYLNRKPEKMDYSLIWNVKAPTRGELDEYLTHIKSRNDTKKLSVLEKSGSQALILLRFISPSSSYEHVLGSGAMPSSPVVAKEGYETYNVVTPDPKGIKKLAHELEAIGDVRIMRVGDYRSGFSGPALTDKQKDALSVALLNGYYSWPRGVGLVDLARAAKISRRSMQERLRRAEAKLFPHLVKGFLDAKK